MGKQKKKRRDVIRVAWSRVEQATGEKLSGGPLVKPDGPTETDTRNPAAVALSKLGASKGGKARATKLSAKERSRIAREAAKNVFNKPFIRVKSDGA